MSLKSLIQVIIILIILIILGGVYFNYFANYNQIVSEDNKQNIESEIDKLKDPYNNEGISPVDTGKIDKLQSDLDKKLKDIYSNLDPWQTTLVARLEDRPKSKFFIDNIFIDQLQVIQ